jgi:hypothetical protein
MLFIRAKASSFSVGWRDKKRLIVLIKKVTLWWVMPAVKSLGLWTKHGLFQAQVWSIW